LLRCSLFQVVFNGTTKHITTLQFVNELLCWSIGWLFTVSTTQQHYQWHHVLIDRLLIPVCLKLNNTINMCLSTGWSFAISTNQYSCNFNNLKSMRSLWGPAGRLIYKQRHKPFLLYCVGWEVEDRQWFDLDVFNTNKKIQLTNRPHNCVDIANWASSIAQGC